MEYLVTFSQDLCVDPKMTREEKIQASFNLYTPIRENLTTETNLFGMKMTKDLFGKLFLVEGTEKQAKELKKFLEENDIGTLNPFINHPIQLIK